VKSGRYLLRFAGNCCLHPHSANHEFGAATSVDMYQTIPRHIEEENNFHSHCRESLKSHTEIIFIHTLHCNNSCIKLIRNLFQVKDVTVQHGEV
jgi:hypothetical protein